MMKWILALVIVGLLAGFVTWQLNATKTTYVNGLALYAQLPGREYILEHDCYIFNFKGQTTSWPLVGANFPGAPLSVPELPAEVSPRYVGADLPGVRIIDLVRTGDRFRIVSVRRDASRRGTRISFEIRLLREPEPRYPRLDAYWIMDHRPEQRGEAPAVLPDYAVERERK